MASSLSLADKLQNIINRYNNLTLQGVKHNISQLIPDIKESINKDLYDSFMIEFDCVKMECTYGDFDEDTEMVKNDFMISIQKIMNVL